MPTNSTPYHFVPVRPDAAVHDAPVLHDGTCGELWSGELHCELTALTPLLCGNDQMEFSTLDGALKEGIAKTLGVSPDNTKSLIEPLALPPDGAQSVAGLPGAVLIPGSQIKGAVRHSVGALLSAPMERVAERTSSFRPNLKDANNIRPAVIHGRYVEADGRISLEYQFTGECDQILYVRRRAERVLERFLQDRGDLPRNKTLCDLASNVPVADINAVVPGLVIDRNKKSYALKLDAQEGGKEDLQDYVLVRYRGGLDGKGSFGRAFNMQDGYTWALVPMTPDGEVYALPPNVVGDYYSTLDHLGDRHAGHLRDHPLRKKLAEIQPAINANFKHLRQGPFPGDLIFIEDHPQTGEIIGIGHHFRHRRRYRDTVHLSKNPQYGKRAPSGSPPGYTLRDVLSPSPAEQTVQPNGQPSQLTGARGLFGFVGASDNGYHSDQALVFGVGDGDFAQLAGRVAINMAVEQEAGRANRFVVQDRLSIVPLKALGAPKPSAVEHYLTQDTLHLRKDDGTLCTYGDSAGDASAGNLRGRKFFLHQPLAATDASRYAVPLHASPADPMLASDQAHLARFVSLPGTAFRFTIRVRDLREWELGALLFALTADGEAVRQLADALALPPASKVRQWLNKVDAVKSQPLLALKLGHGRPLGLGSVRIAIKSGAQLLMEQGQPVLRDLDAAGVLAERASALKAFAAKLQTQIAKPQLEAWTNSVLLPWLLVHQYAGRRSFDYPTAHGKDGTTIYYHHTQMRGEHAVGRKEKNTGVRQPRGLKDLDLL